MPSCGWSGSGPAEAYCALTLNLESGIGDEAACIELCSCDDPCSHPGALCYAWGSVQAIDPALLVEIEHDGLCLMPDWVIKGMALDCGAGGAGGG